jgi:hypothetical protein
MSTLRSTEFEEFLKTVVDPTEPFECWGATISPVFEEQEVEPIGNIPALPLSPLRRSRVQAKGRKPVNEKDSPASAPLEEPTWDHQFAAIVRFKDKCGSFPASGHLHHWLQEQRRSVDSLSSERIEKLHKLGFNLIPVGVQVWKPISLVPMPAVPSVDPQQRPQCSRPKETKRKYRTKQKSVPLKEMQRLMKEYGPTVVPRKFKPQDDLQTESLKRKFYRWFPDLEERFVASADGLTYTPKAGHDEEVAYRSAMRKKSQKILVQHRNNSRWALNRVR